MSLPTETRLAQPRSLTIACSASSSAGKSTPAMRRTPTSATGPFATSRSASWTASSNSPCSTSRQPGRPRWCGELSGPRTSREHAPVDTDEREIGLRVAAVDGEDDRRRHASASLPGPRQALRLRREQALDQLLVQRMLSDQRMCEQRLARDRRSPVAAAWAASRSYAATCWVRPSSSGASGSCGSGTIRPSSTRAGTSTTSSSARPASVPAFRTSTSCTTSSPLTSESDETRRGLAVEGAAALLEQGGLLVQRRVAIELEQAPLDLGDDLGARRPFRAARPGSRRGGRSTEGRATGRRRAPRAAAAAGSACSATASPCEAISSREHVAPVEVHRPDPRQVVETDLVDDDLRRLDAEMTRERALEADRDVAEADGAMPGIEQRARDDPDRVREVDDPRVRARSSSRTRSAISSTTGTVRSALAKPPAPVVSWPMQPQASGTVSSESRASCPPTRIWSRTKSAPSSARSRSPVTCSSPAKPCRSSIRAARPPTTSRRSSSMSCSDELAHVDLVALPREPRDRARACTSSRRR